MVLPFYFTPSLLFAQASEDPALKEEYCVVEIQRRAATDRVTAKVDFGKGEEKLEDSAGNTKFGSRTAVLNYLGQQNWKLVTSYREEDRGDFLIFRRLTHQNVSTGKKPNE